jgi:hypothetical protein
LAAEVPTKLVETSPNPIGTVEKAPVSAAAEGDDWRGEVSSAHAATPRSGVIQAARRYHARMLLRLIALLREFASRVREPFAVLTLAAIDATGTRECADTPIPRVTAGHRFRSDGDRDTTA